MADIKGLRQKRAEKIDRMEALFKKASDENRDMTEVESAAYDELRDEVKGLDAQIKRAEEIQALKGSTAQPVTLPTETETAAAPPKTFPQAKRQEEKGLGFARYAKAMAATKGMLREAAHFAENTLKDPELAKALGASTMTAGGALVPDQYSSEVIELLRPASVISRMGPRIVPMPGGTLTMPKLAGGSQASYVGENQNAGKTEPNFGQLRLTARKMAAVVPISNDLIRFSSPSADTLVRDDLVAAMAERGDLAMIRDAGAGNAPKGLRYWAPAGNVIPANATVNLANVTADIGKAVLALKNANVKMMKPGWLMAPRSEEYLLSVRDNNGKFAFRDEMLTGKLRGYPYATTTQIPTNLGGGGDESEVYIADFVDVVIGEVEGIILDASTEAAYHDGSNVVAAFSLDQTVIRAILQHDLGMRHDASVAVLTAVKWTP